MPTLPTGPFELQLINLGLDPLGGSFAHLQVEVSASFGVSLGPFAAIGRSPRRPARRSTSQRRHADRASRSSRRTASASSLDAGIVKGGGYLAVDENGYAGVLELKMLAVDVKAIALLNTHSEAGFSLLLLIFGQFPAIQLSFGFTLTGVGGLIGVQHTASPTALSQALGAGQLDAVLFPENPVANAPQIINTLRTMFPVKAGGFIIGPMLELGWGTPSLVTVRLGLLIEAEPVHAARPGHRRSCRRWSRPISRCCTCGSTSSARSSSIRCSIAFDAKLIHSRVALHLDHRAVRVPRAVRRPARRSSSAPAASIRASRRFPSDIPAPFDRVGASFDIGIVGIEFKGYFAITSATVQAGAALRAWADVGIASIEGGFGFDAICYLVPKFYFEVDLFAYLDVHVFGIDFASIHLDGMLAGPGRWHIAGNAEGAHAVAAARLLAAHRRDAGAPIATRRRSPSTWPIELVEGDREDRQLERAAAAGRRRLRHARRRSSRGPTCSRIRSARWSSSRSSCRSSCAWPRRAAARSSGANEFFGGALQLDAGRHSRCPARRRRQPTQRFLRCGAVPRDVAGRPAREAVVRVVHRRLRARRRQLRAGRDVLEETLNYEEADLGAVPGPKGLRRLALGVYAEATQRRHAALRRGGPIDRCATARSRSRRSRRAIKRQSRAGDGRRQVTLTVAAGAGIYTSVWRAIRRATPVRPSHVASLTSSNLRRCGMTIPYRFVPWARRGLARAHTQSRHRIGGRSPTRPRITVGLTLQAKQRRHHRDRGVGQRRPDALRTGRRDRHRSASDRAHRSAAERHQLRAELPRDRRLRSARLSRGC